MRTRFSRLCTCLNVTVQQLCQHSVALGIIFVFQIHVHVSEKGFEIFCVICTAWKSYDYSHWVVQTKVIVQTMTLTKGKKSQHDFEYHSSVSQSQSTFSQENHDFSKISVITNIFGNSIYSLIASHDCSHDCSHSHDFQLEIQI